MIQPKSPPNHLIPATGLDDTLLMALAKTYPTPFFVYDAERIERDLAALRGALPAGVEVLYSVKANPSLSIIRHLWEQGSGFEISSPGEMAALVASRVPLSQAVYVGPGKTLEELKAALSGGIGFVAVESIRELFDLEHAAFLSGVRAKALLRLNPGSGEGQQKMAGATQFGMDINDARKALGEADTLKNVEIEGIHCYLGTMLLNPEHIAANMAEVFQQSARLQAESGKRFTAIDLGGGFGVGLFAGHTELDRERLLELLLPLFEEYREAHPWTEKILAEAGRYLVARCGVLVARVIDVKRVHGKLFAVVDGGIHAIGGRDGYFGSRPTPMRFIGLKGGPIEEINICGPLCTPSDRLASRVLMEVPRCGDLLAVYIAGAYGLTASAGLFLSRGFPAEIMVKGGGHALVRPPFDWESALAGQQILSERFHLEMERDIDSQ